MPNSKLLAISLVLVTGCFRLEADPGTNDGNHDSSSPYGEGGVASGSGGAVQSGHGGGSCDGGASASGGASATGGQSASGGAGGAQDPAGGASAGGAAAGGAGAGGDGAGGAPPSVACFLYPDCDASISSECLCLGCPGGCDVDADCICPDCAGNALCEACNLDGLCDPYLETCACADCAAHPMCAP